MLSKFKLSTFLMGFTCFIIITSTAFIGVSQSSSPSVQLVTTPPIAQVTPLEAEATKYLGSGKYDSPVQLKLQARDAAGKALQNTEFHLQILAPAPTPWFTTDFPIVEGTKLLDIVGDAPTGEFLLQQVFPIRGNYQIKVDVTPTVANAFVPIEQTLNLTVPENPLKLTYFPFVLAVLLVIGFGGGWVIGGSQQIKVGEVAPRPVRLLLSGVTVLAIASLLFFNISAELVKAQSGMESETLATNNYGLVESQGLKLELTGDKSIAVGQMATFQAKLTDIKTNQPVSDVMVAIKSTQLENNWVAFGYQGVANSLGLLTWQEQFFDGAPHRVEVEVSPSPISSQQFQPFKASQEIDVEGIAPPMSVRFIGLFYFTTVLVFGLITGLWLQRRRLQQRSTSSF
ncbi:MAG: hypothetical protein IM535_12275 [Pseudanabaena sp. M38BS1SP1A06MG]|nr:hypothetical protein [Pseudanabaena sp. M53BS1SP1A06MG]MCA6592856.1 hypothetical protein [Pseudanabaena sp. M38BS1SP1A06MG]